MEVSSDSIRAGQHPILLVEDNPTDVFLVREAFAAHRIEADLTVIQDGEQAISFVGRLDQDEQTVCPKLVLVDLNLPRKTGLEVLSSFRQSTRGAEIPIVVMSSSAASTDRAQSAILGASVYFLKPSGYEEFLAIGEIVRKLLKE